MASEEEIVDSPTGWVAQHILVDHPEVELQVGADRFAARARTATAEEKPLLWQLMASILPQYNSYQEKAERDIPVVIVERAC